MKWVAFLLLGALWGPAVCPADTPWDVLREEDVLVEYRDGTYRAHLEFRVSVPPARVVEVLTDFEHMAEFVPNLVSSRVVSHAGNVYRIYQQGKAVFGPFSFPFESERRIEWFPEGKIVAQALSGSSRYMRSELRYQGITGGTRIDYRLEVIPDRWMPSGLGVNFMEHELAEQFSALAVEMSRRQAGRPPRQP